MNGGKHTLKTKNYAGHARTALRKGTDKSNTSPFEFHSVLPTKMKLAMATLSSMLAVSSPMTAELVEMHLAEEAK